MVSSRPPWATQGDAIPKNKEVGSGQITGNPTHPSRGGKGHFRHTSCFSKIPGVSGPQVKCELVMVTVLVFGHRILLCSPG